MSKGSNIKARKTRWVSDKSRGTRPDADPTPCRKGCCWTPYGMCAKGQQCACHTPREISLGLCHD